MSRRPLVLALLAAVLLGLTVTAAPTSSAAEVDRTCATVEGIFARGSGQDPNAAEFRAFDREIDDRLSGAVTYDSYELGTESYGAAQYKAVDVENVWNGNALGAKFSSGMANDYGDRVKAGVDELTAYLTARADTCRTAEGTSTVALSWLPSDLRADRWAVAVNGVPVGLAPGDQTRVEITDVDRSEDVELSVAGMTAEHEVGDAARTTLESDGSTPAGPTTPTSPAPGSQAPPGPTAPASPGADPSPSGTTATPTSQPAAVVPPTMNRPRAAKGGLAFTGAVVFPVLALGAALIVAGGIAYRIGRHRRLGQ
ncbi:hypothetical protein [Blastococcus atacamensis]|uniref:hypothetical protein n=1 Tax=Blastococcus atacamensis TaxID=2070508 RepID=UPI000CEC8437|nr:hypothetical protein [Blastococcus atacamensis]